MHSVLDLTCNLIRRPSITPSDNGCQILIAERLEKSGFNIEHLPFGQVSNLWATHGQGSPVMVFLGHTDVVPTGPESSWNSPPFEPVIREGYLYGRGTADMKGSVAAMTIALENFVRAYPHHHGTVAILLTSDEEGEAKDGICRVVEEFRNRGQQIDHCVVGEPSARERLGDLIRIGRRGSLSGHLVVKGIQGHVAYPEKACNPIHALAPTLAELTKIRWDEGNEAFPPTSMQISNIYSGTGANNVIPGILELRFNFRYGTASSAEELQSQVESVLQHHAINYKLTWDHSGKPFLTKNGRLREAVIQTIQTELRLIPQADTGGGTSDGRFIAAMGAEVVEIGPINASIHKVNECISVSDLERLPALYQRILENLANQF